MAKTIPDLKDKKSISYKDLFTSEPGTNTPNRIRILRLVAGLDIKSMANALGISPSMLQQIETSKKSISIKVLKKVSDMFGVTVDYVLFSTGKPYGYEKDDSMDTDLEVLREFFKKEGIQC